MSRNSNDDDGPDVPPPARPPVRQRVRPQPLPEPHDDDVQGDDGEDLPSPPYKVGYGKPPRHNQFKPGTSGNPKGRPRAAKGMKTIVHATLSQKVTVRTASGSVRMSRMEAILHKTIELAMKGNIRAATQLVALYNSAVPDPTNTEKAEAQEELTAADLEILELLHEELSAAKKKK